jgi:hypothetical protein
LLTVFSTSHQLDFWLRHCYPADVAAAALLFDDTIRRMAVVALGSDPWTDPVAAERVRLPGRKGGLGLRRAADVSGPAFLAGAVAAVSAFLDRFEEVDGAPFLVQQGVLERPAIVARVGRGAFDDMGPGRTGPGPEGGWHCFFRSGSRLGAEMLAIWGALRARGGVALRAADDGPLRVLDLLPHCIWAQTEAGLQADICADIEDWLYEQLRQGVVGAPPSRMRAVMLDATRETLVWTRALPQGRAVPVQEWVELVARSLGLPSPMFAPLVGLPCARPRAGRPQRLVDPHGDIPCAAPGLEGDHYARLRHDPLCDALAGVMRAAGVPALREDAAAFAGVPMAHAEVLRRLFARAGARKRYPTPDITADLPGPGPAGVHAAVPTIVEVKTIVYCPSWYRDSDVRERAAVGRRAAAVPVERRRQLAALDRELFATAEGARGPFEARLDAFPGGVLGVAVGAFGEWSESLVDMVHGLAEQGAERWMGRLAAPSMAQARATLLRLWRQHLGMGVLRGHARLMVARAQQLYLRQGRDGGAGWARGEARAPVGAGPEVGDSAFARAVDGACCRGDGGGARGRPRDFGARRPRDFGARGAWAARAARARG